MKQANFDKMIDTLKAGKKLTFWTAYKGTETTAKHIPMFKNDKEDAPGFWIGKTYYMIPCIKITVS
jgi:hypothetical protein